MNGDRARQGVLPPLPPHRRRGRHGDRRSQQCSIIENINNSEFDNPRQEPIDAASPTDLIRLQDKAADAARLLRLLANEKRLLILLLLVARSEMDVTSPAGEVELSQSARSRHLAKLREDRLVAFRREGQSIHYRLDDARAARVLATLKDIFCPDLG